MQQNKIYNYLLSDKSKNKLEQVILSLAILSFLVHLVFIYLIQFGVITLRTESELFNNPIAAIYTPFSFILIYEVYLLIYYLPKSITTYVSKQYEIITLIIIRRLFKDLSNLELTSDWFQVKDDLQFTYDIVASVLLFFLLFLFLRQSRKTRIEPQENAKLPGNMMRFIHFKKIIAFGLVPVLFFLATYTLINWALITFNQSNESSIYVVNINNIFFVEFFTLLIIVDVILLLLSFYHTDKFHKVIRNSGFVISTILIRLSFSVEGLINSVLIVAAVVFGLLILTIHNLYEKKPVNASKPAD